MVTYLLLLIAFALGNVELLIFFSNKTSNSLISYFQTNLIQKIGDSATFETILITANRSTDFFSFFKEYATVTIDAMFDAALSQILLSVTESLEILNFYLDPNMTPTGLMQYYAHAPWQEQLTATKKIVDYLGWNKNSLLGSDSLESLRILTQFEKEFGTKVKSKMILSDIMTKNSMEDIAGRIFKPNGLENFIVFVEGDYIEDIVSSLINKKIYKVGCGILIWSKGIWGMRQDGLVYLVEQGLENASSYEEYEALAIRSLTLLLKSYFNSLSNGEVAITNELLKQFIGSNVFNHGKMPIYSIVNIINSSPVIVGTLSNAKISFSQEIIYPGNTTENPLASKANLYMSLTTSGQELDGTFNSFQLGQVQGNMYARDWINNRTSILENFYIKFTENKCGTTVFIHDLTANCYKPIKNELGIVFLSSDYYVTNVGMILLLREWNISIAFVAAATTSPLLSNKTLYPELVRVVPSGTYNAVIILKLCQVFGWKHVNVLYANSTTNKVMYNTFVSEADKAGIEIVNDETKRMLPPNYMRTQFETYKYVFQEIMDSKTRIFITFQTASSNYQAVEGLYDIGLRKEDVVVILPSKTGGQATIKNYSQDFLPKLLEFLCGCLSVSAVEYVDDFGNQIRNGMANYWGNPPDFKGSHFDQTLLAAYGIDFTIKKGEDYENAEILMKNIRAQRIIGASGTIAIDSTSNDRSFMILSINNFYKTTTAGVYNDSIVGYYIPTSSIPLQINSDIIWPGLVITTPADSILINSDCPFDMSLSQDSVSGTVALSIVCFSIVLLAFIASFYTWKRISIFRYPKLIEKKEIQFADSVIIFMMIIEVFQYADIGPKLKYDSISEYLGSIFNIDLEKILDLKGIVYWIWINIIFGVICFWAFMCIIIHPRSEKYVLAVFFLRWIYELKNLLKPVLGNMLFLPILNNLITVFRCSKATGDDLNQSYMDINCNYYCWQGTHLNYAIFSYIALIIYLLIAIVYRSRWINIHDDEHQHLKCQPENLIIKSAFQVLFVGFNKTISILNSSVRGFLCFGLFIIFIAYNIKKPPFNYDRMNMWQIMLLCCLAWSSLTASISIEFESFSLWLMVVNIIGWGIFIGTGLFLQAYRFPAILVTPQQLSIALLFKFMLTSRIGAESIGKRNLNFASGIYHLEKEIEASSLDKTESISKMKSECPILVNHQIEILEVSMGD